MNERRDASWIMDDLRRDQQKETREKKNKRSKKGQLRNRTVSQLRRLSLWCLPFYRRLSRPGHLRRVTGALKTLIFFRNVCPPASNRLLAVCYLPFFVFLRSSFMNQTSYHHDLLKAQTDWVMKWSANEP